MRKLHLLGMALSLLFTVALLVVLGVYLKQKFSPEVTSTVTSVPKWVSENQITISDKPGIKALQLKQGAALLLNGAEVIKQHNIDLRAQLAEPHHSQSGLKPVFVGVKWSLIETLIKDNGEKGLDAHFGIANPLIDDNSLDVPDLVVDTYPPRHFLSLNDKPGDLAIYPLASSGRSIKWVSDVQELTSTWDDGLKFKRQGWLMWGEMDANAEVWSHAIKFERLGMANTGKRMSVGVLRISLLKVKKAASAINPTSTVYYFPSFTGDNNVIKTHLKAGNYAETQGIIEDELLFERAVRQGLIKANQGAVIVASKDAAVAAAQARMPWNEVKRDTLKALYVTTPGQYIRQNIDLWNSESHTAGLRYKGMNSEAKKLLRQAHWQAKTDERELAFGGRAPLRSAALFQSVPKGWSDWKMVVTDEYTETVNVELTFNAPATGQEQFNFMVIGQSVKLMSGRLREAGYRCLSNKCSQRKSLALNMRVSPNKGQRKLIITLNPLQPSAARLLYRLDHQPVFVEDDQPKWKGVQDKYIASNRNAVPVKITDRNGVLLWEDYENHDLDIPGYHNSMYGLSTLHSNSLGGMLKRLGDHGFSTVNSRLTLDKDLQNTARKFLLDHITKASSLSSEQKRFGSIVILDVDTGEILASASAPEPSKGVGLTDLFAFDAADYARSPLRNRGFQHDGYSYNAPGSVFKLVVAAALEEQAKTNNQLLNSLVGLSPVKLNKAGEEYRFSAYADCYPAQKGCFKKTGIWPKSSLKDQPVVNYRGKNSYETPDNMRQHKETAYGLSQAIRDSLNTWFAWQAEKLDQTLISAEQTGVVSARELTPGALAAQRPIFNMANKLGFFDATRLDAGLLPQSFPWRSGDLLQVSPSNIDPFQDRGNVRQAAIGLRMQVTPLHVAQLAASIASGRSVKAHLLKELNGKLPAKPEFSDLDIDFSRIHEGMKAVPVTGTAKMAFRDPVFHGLRERIYLKTGTAPIYSSTKRNNKTNLNTAWVTGWLEPQKVGESRVAFACMLGYSSLTGGKDCAPLIAKILYEMELKSAKSNLVAAKSEAPKLEF